MTWDEILILLIMVMGLFAIDMLVAKFNLKAGRIVAVLTFFVMMPLGLVAGIAALVCMNVRAKKVNTKTQKQPTEAMPKQTAKPQTIDKTVTDNADELNEMGITYYTGRNGVAKDMHKAFECLKKAADMGHIEAIANLGVMYCHGFGVEKNIEKAIMCFEKAADEGNTIAMNNLGRMYLTGEKIPKDETKAFKWLGMAAIQGDAEAKYNIGVMYLNGTGCEKDETQALYMFEQAANQGHPVAQYNAGVCYEGGFGTAQNIEKAHMFYKQSAAQGYQPAVEKLKNIAPISEADRLFKMGVKYYTGQDYTIVDMQKAFDCFEQAATLGHIGAKCNMGVMFCMGQGVEINTMAAISLFSDAAFQGDSAGQNNLGCMCHRRNDLKEAEEWFAKAAAQGDAVAQQNLNVMRGTGSDAQGGNKVTFRIYS